MEPGHQVETSDTLVEFLYKDTQLISSFVSQVFKGQTIEVIRTNSSRSLDDKGFKVGLAVFDINANDENVQEEIIASKVDPFDYLILELLDAIKPQQFSENASDNATKITYINGELSIRNFDETRKMLSIVEKIGSISSLSQPLSQKSAGKHRKYSQADFIRDAIDLFDKGFQVDLVDAGGLYYSILCKEQFFTTAPQTLMMNYGTFIPSNWTVVGIVDKKTSGKEPHKAKFKNAIDEIRLVVQKSIEEDDPCNYIVRPIIIYRKIDY